MTVPQPEQQPGEGVAHVSVHSERERHFGRRETCPTCNTAPASPDAGTGDDLPTKTQFANMTRWEFKAWLAAHDAVVAAAAGAEAGERIAQAIEAAKDDPEPELSPADRYYRNWGLTKAAAITRAARVEAAAATEQGGADHE